MNKQMFFKQIGILKVSFVMGILFLAACTFSTPTFQQSVQMNGGCLTSSVVELRNCMTAVASAQLVDAYTLGYLK